VNEREIWRLTCFRNTAVHLTMVLENEFAEVATLLEYAARHAGFDAIREMQAARDAMMKFINVLDGIETPKEEKQVFESLRQLFSSAPSQGNSHGVAVQAEPQKEQPKPMFTSEEEAVLRRLIAENTPLARPVIDPITKGHNPPTGDYLQRELAKCRPIETIDLEKDWPVINRLRNAGVLKNGEKVGEFYARTSIGRAQILAMSNEELQKAASLADERNLADGGFRTFAEAR